MFRMHYFPQYSRFAFSLLLCSLFISLNAAAQDAAPEASPSAEPPTPPTPASEPEVSEEARDLIAKKDKALLAYGLGNVDASLSNLRTLISACDDLGQEACPDSVRAELYVALAIVLAGGKNDIPAAARLFHAALTRDAEVMVPREYATLPVQKAMREANESTSYNALEGEGEDDSAPPTPPEAQPADDASDAPPEEPPQGSAKQTRGDNKTGILLLYGLIGAGSAERWPTGNQDVGTAGVAGVLGVRMVKGSGWTTAIRGRASTVGHAELSGVALLMGGSWFNPRSRNLGYFMGGLGLDSYGGEAALTAVGMGGVALKGFLLGAGVDFGAGNGTYGLMTFHIGWGGRI